MRILNGMLHLIKKYEIDRAATTGPKKSFYTLSVLKWAYKVVSVTIFFVTKWNQKINLYLHDLFNRIFILYFDYLCQ